jgi:hypothetical protein
MKSDTMRMLMLIDNVYKLIYICRMSNILFDNQRSRRILFDIRIRRSGGIEYS